MAANQTPRFALTAHNESSQFTSADGATAKTVFTAGANGSRIDEIVFSQNDVHTAVFALYIRIGGTDYQLGSVTVNASSGFTTNPPTFAMQAFLSRQYLDVPANGIVKMACPLAMPVGVTMEVQVRGSDY